MSHGLPRPGLSALILGLWLVLAPAPTIGQVLIGLVLAIALPLATRGFWPGEVRVRRPFTALRLFGVVIVDIVTANLLVARQVLGPSEVLRPAFLDVPLDIADPFVSTLFGSIVSLTPGTVSVDIDHRQGVLRVHALHVEDAVAAVAHMKSRYEAPLKEVFGC